MAVPLIVNADDYGLTDATSRAILEAHRTGVVTATSVLAVVDGIERRLSWLDDAPGLAVGVHLALVGEDPPVLSAREVPSLVDDRGRFAASWRSLLPRLIGGRVDPADIRRELDTQIERVRTNRRITHLDSHQHLHLWPSVGAVVVELALAHEVPAVRVPRPSGRGVRARSMRVLAERLDRRVGAAGLRRTDRFRGIEEAGGWDLDRLRQAVEDLAAGSGSVELNCHPGASVDPDRARYRWGYRWEAERSALCAAELRSDIDRLGFRLARPDEL
jgi:predicted glycoside hydrolase/deacetylase ChbG (UPF0249 family)